MRTDQDLLQDSSAVQRVSHNSYIPVHDRHRHTQTGQLRGHHLQELSFDNYSVLRKFGSSQLGEDLSPQLGP